LYPRVAYYVLKEAHKFDPYSSTATPELLESHFSNIEIMDAITKTGDNNATNQDKSY
jgi:hypothetical protein